MGKKKEQEETMENPMVNCVLKFDHFEHIHRLPENIRKFEGAPNFRQVDGYKVFGTGQPTKEGFKSVLDYMFKEGHCDEILWTSMRQEPVVYLNGESFTPRNPDKMNENMEFPDAGPKMLEWFQQALVVAVKGRVGDDKQVVYYRDTYAEHPDDRENKELKAPLDNDGDFVTLAGMYDQLKEAGYNLKYSRAPIQDEKSPSEKDFDSLCRALVNEDKETGYIFNCQMGKGRTTTGMVIGCLIKEAQMPPASTYICPERYFPANPMPNLKLRWKKKTQVKMGKGGWYKCVREMMALFDVKEDKDYLDHVINLCGDPPKGEGLQNLRECINWAKEKHDGETVDKAEFWLRMGRNFVERYMYLICFTSYVREQAWIGFHQCDLAKRMKHFPFHNWMSQKAGLREWIQTARNHFNWEV